jgi:hypothetical protein
MNERHAYLIAGTSLVCAAVCGLLIIALRNQRPCPCAEHTPEAEAARVAQASAEVAQAPTLSDPYLNGKVMDSEQAEVSE